jgi:transcription initiation factor TFIIIB Brf1 subunit/transcription initiation factor TFIIB
MKSVDNIALICDKMVLPEFIKFDACMISDENKMLRKGGGKDGFDNACIYIACRLKNIPRTFADFARTGNCRKLDVTKKYNKIMQNNYAYKVDIQNPLIFVDQLVSRCNVSAKTIKDTRDAFLNKSDLCSMVGQNPMIRAGAILYFYAHENNDPITQRDMAYASDLAEVSIRNNYKKYKHIIHRKMFSKEDTLDTEIYGMKKPVDSVYARF